MKIMLADLVKLCKIFNHIPPETPNRIDLVLEYAESIIEKTGKADKNFGEVTLDIPMDIEHFSLTKDVLICMSIYIATLNNALLLKENNSLPLILLPSQLRCCSKVLSIISTYAEIPIYTENGCCMGRSYHSKCRLCKTCHYHGFSIDKNFNELRFVEDESEYFVVNTSIGFSKKFMRYADNAVCIGGISFEKTAEMLSSNYLFDPPLNPD